MIDVPTRVKDALKKGTYRKNWKMIVLKDDGSADFTINNDYLVKDTVKLDERMCSGDELKFGLCEGSSLEFQYFGKPNIKGRRIQAKLEIEYKTADGELDWYEMPMGFFDVSQCPRQFDTGIMKVTAFNKLKSDYLDQKANAKIIDSMDNPDTEISFVDIRRILLDGYEIIEEETRTFDRGSGIGNSLYPIKNLKITQNYGIDNVFCNINISTSSTYQIELRAYGKQYIFNTPSVVQVDDVAESIESIERDVFRYISEYFENVPMNMTHDQFLDGLFNLDITGSHIQSWGDFFGIEIAMQGKGRKKYSTIGYEHGCSDIDGTFKDLFRTTFTDCWGVTFNIPREISLSTSNGDSVASFPFSDRIYASTYNEYSWYADASKTIINKTKLYPYRKPNGDYMNNDSTFLENVYKVTNYTEADLVQINPTDLADISLRDATSAVYEMSCVFGQLDRETDLFSGVELNHSRLTPAGTLYPKNDLYPMSSSERANASMYQKLWTDSGSQKKFKYLIITYKGTDSEGKEIERTLQRTVNADGNVNYNMSDNWLFKNLVWTADQVGEFADAMVEKMRDVSWIPFEMWSAGLPYLETGDELEIKTNEGTAVSYILTRQLTGIHNLMDTYTNGTLDIF